MGNQTTHRPWRDMIILAKLALGVALAIAVVFAIIVYTIAKTAVGLDEHLHDPMFP